jgi:hypothetical protein
MPQHKPSPNSHLILINKESFKTLFSFIAKDLDNIGEIFQEYLKE